jgi:anthranilate phosphoribosyltransferase
VADEMARDIKEGLEMATDTIESGRASEHLERIISVSGKM